MDDQRLILVASRIDPDLPVIVLTGRTGEADRVRSFARGADDHVCKPLASHPLSLFMPIVVAREEPAALPATQAPLGAGR